MSKIVLTCNICGRPCLENAIVCTEPVAYVMCPQCFQHCGTCALCISARECLFETSPSLLPKQIQQTIRQGNMTMQSIVKNPDRIRETCQKGCKCWSDDLGCLKQNGTCGQYKEVIPNVKM